MSTNPVFNALALTCALSTAVAMSALGDKPEPIVNKFPLMNYMHPSVRMTVVQGFVESPAEITWYEKPELAAVFFSATKNKFIELNCEEITQLKMINLINARKASDSALKSMHQKQDVFFSEAVKDLKCPSLTV